MRDKIFYTICFGFILGVLLGTFVFIDLYLIFLFGIMALFLIIFFSFISKSKIGILLSIFILVFLLGILRFNFYNKNAPEFFESKVGQKVNFTGEIVDEPDISESNQKLIVLLNSGDISKRTVLGASLRTVLKNQKTKILITTGFEQDFKYGDKINLFGNLKKPENFMPRSGQRI